ncbi:MAG: hypothetical protein KDD94_00045 [Calditrichaeota bacterium]|nr:hypothetical protein [Calditrichota bacterium]
MTPGEILHYRNYKLPDGSYANKFVLQLNDGQNYPFILARLTSQHRHYSRSSGCQNDDRFPNYYLPKETKHMPEDSWILFSDLKELDAESFNRCVKNKTLIQKSKLSTSIFNEILDCLIDSDDISGIQKDILRKIRR